MLRSSRTAIVVLGLPVAERRNIARRSIGDCHEPPNIDRGCRRQRRPPPAQSSRQRTDTAEDKERRLRARTVRRRLLLVEGHRPAPAERRQLHQRAKSADVAAGGVGGRAAGDRGAARPDGARGPLLLRNDRVGGGGGPEGHRPRLRRRTARPMPARTIPRWRGTTRRRRPHQALFSTAIGAGCPRRHSCVTSGAICRRTRRASSTRFSSRSRNR